MRLLAGTSGYAFKEWKGSFYPEGVKDDGMLGYYATRFPTVEINNTFYRLPRENVLQAWASQVPDTFTFAIKASQRITHYARLKPESKDLLQYLLQNTTVLGSKLGPVLFQLPPNMEKNIDRLRTFLDFLPPGRRFTFEFRHSSWFDEDVVAALKEKDVAMTIIDQDDFVTPPIATASWGYVRLHRLDYSSLTLAQWAERIKEPGWTDAYVYFKHDEGVGSGPPAVDAFRQLF
ncbi:MAG TPA: DUF72 domain-containing protein [Gemmatimonadaceae bacterium]